MKMHSVATLSQSINHETTTKRKERKSKEKFCWKRVHNQITNHAHTIHGCNYTEKTKCSWTCDKRTVLKDSWMIALSMSEEIEEVQIYKNRKIWKNLLANERLETKLFLYKTNISTLRLNITEKLIKWRREMRKLMRQRGRNCLIELLKRRVENKVGTSLAVQRLRRWTSTAGPVGLIPGWRIKIPHARWHNQKGRKKK